MHRIAPLVLPPGPVNFIHVDPTNPQRSPLEKRPRSQAEIDKQREDSSALRKAGGACLWCMRSRKKCVPQSPCNFCYTSEQRICIREPEHLYLFGKPPGSPFQTTRLPSVEGSLTLEEMERIVFSETMHFQAVLSICQKDTFLQSRAWIVTKSKSNLMEKETLVDSFIDMAISCLDCAELSELEASYSNQLVRKALQMARLFIATRCMAQTRIFASTADVASGRLVMFFVLVRCVRRLAEMSWALCFRLYEFLRHKDMGDYEPKTKKDLDPVWVATALYVRTANGLNALRDNPVIGKILGPGCQIGVICQVIGNILDHTFPRQKYISTSRIRGIFEAAIPELSSPPSSFDIAFLQGPSGIGQGSYLPPESCYLMTTFLSDGFPPSDSPLPLSSEVAEALMAIRASLAAPITTTQDAQNDASFVNLDSTSPLDMLQDANQTLGANTPWRSGSLETFESTDSTDTLPGLPDTVPRDWALGDPSMGLDLDSFDTISGDSFYCSCCSYCCDHDADTEGCCSITECSPGKCYCPYGRSPS